MRRTFAAVISLACVLVVIGMAFAQTVTPQAYLPLIENPPTVTPIPATPTTEPTPTQQPTGVFILGGTSSYVDSIDYLHVIGEVQNNTSKVIQFVKITANFFSGTGQLVGTDFTYTYLDRLPP